MLSKREVVYREVLSKALAFERERQFSFTQLSLAKKFGFSLSTVNNALKPLAGIGAIEKKPRSFSIVDARKALVFWATARRFSRDIVYSTRSKLPPQKIEGSMPSSVVFTAYSGYRLFFGDAPADYGEVYVYVDEKTLEELKERFPEEKGPANVFALEKDEFMPNESIVPLAQLYVDLWNLKEWYAKDFLEALEKKFFKESNHSIE